MNRLDLVVGPNGAGKSTFVELTLAPLLPGSPFVNADEIAKHRWPADPAAHAYEAARVAADTRAKLIKLRRTFIAETVFSHPSKLELIEAAHAADYTVVLHVLLVPEELAVQRVEASGHRWRTRRAGGQDSSTLPTPLGPGRYGDHPVRLRHRLRQQRTQRTSYRGPNERRPSCRRIQLAGVGASGVVVAVAGQPT